MATKSIPLLNPAFSTRDGHIGKPVWGREAQLARGSVRPAFSSKTIPMKRLAHASIALLFFVPSVSFAAALTSQQANSLIAVVQSSPNAPASAFTSLITAFSNITVAQANSLIGVVQASPSAPASAFVNLLTSFTIDTAAIQPTTQAGQSNQQSAQSSYPNSCNGVGSPSCPSGYTFSCPSTGAGYCAINPASSSAPTCASQIEAVQQKIIDIQNAYYSGSIGPREQGGMSASNQLAVEERSIEGLTAQEEQLQLTCEQQIQQEKTVIGEIDLQIASCNAKAASIANQINNPEALPGGTIDQVNTEISMEETANTANCTAPAESQLASEELKLSGLTSSLQIAESIVVP